MRGQVTRTQTTGLPKLIGADAELGNFIVGGHPSRGTPADAARALLLEVDGVPAASRCLRCRERPNPQDWGRRFLATNGSSIYIDLNHLELCIPEVRSAHDYVASWHAMLRIARGALLAANAKRKDDGRIAVLINTSDGQDHSYGNHLSFLLTRQAWDNIFDRKPHYLAFLAAFQTSAIVFTGQGKVGSENGAPPVAFQLSQRADFISTVVSPKTTSSRPVVNSRNEALCGDRFRDMARLHVICFDATLAHTACLLKAGTMQIILAMIEAGEVDAALALDDPVEAVRRWSHDPTLKAGAVLVDGRTVTAVKLQQRFLHRAKTFVRAGGCNGTVPRADAILALWEDTLHKLAAYDLQSLTRRLDWVLKLVSLEQVRERHPQLSWDAPAKHLDHLYSSLDDSEGLYWACERSGLVDRLVSDAEIEQFVQEPPSDTRAWMRAHLLRLARPGDVDQIDWDVMRFGLGNGWPSTTTVRMPNPLASATATLGRVFASATTLEEALEALRALPKERTDQS